MNEKCECGFNLTIAHPLIGKLTKKECKACRFIMYYDEQEKKELTEIQARKLIHEAVINWR